MNKPLKKIIAREGLVLSAFIAALVFVVVFSKHYPRLPDDSQFKRKITPEMVKAELEKREKIKAELDDSTPLQSVINERYAVFQQEVSQQVNRKRAEILIARGKILFDGLLYVPLGYAGYLIFRFIGWSIRTLKEKT